MSVFSTGPGAGLYVKSLTDVIGIGATINAAGQFVASTGPEIRRVTASPNGTISDFGGSLALDVTNGVVYVNTATGNVAGTSWRVVALGASTAADARLFSSTADSATITGNGAVQYFDVSYTVPANTLNLSNVLRVTGSVRRVLQNGADTIALQIEVGGVIFSGVVAVAAAAGTRCFFDSCLTARAAASATSSCAGSTSIIWPSVAASAGGNISNLATNAGLLVRVGCNMPNNVANTAILEQLVVTVS
jgi:hypothetical protein